MPLQPFLSELEWQIIIGLLEAERRELPVEIRHTDSIAVHEELRRRMASVDELLAKLRDMPADVH
jgi:hypothetical protein